MYLKCECVGGNFILFVVKLSLFCSYFFRLQWPVINPIAPLIWISAVLLIWKSLITYDTVQVHPKYQMHTWDFIIPKTGYWPLNGLEDPLLVNVFATSLPWISLCSGTHSSITILWLARVIRSSRQLRINFVLTHDNAKLVLHPDSRRWKYRYFYKPLSTDLTDNELCYYLSPSLSRFLKVLWVLIFGRIFSMKAYRP